MIAGSSFRLGTAGWSIPRAVADAFPDGGSALERYAARFDAAEINSTFYRSHRPSTYARWAASVPGDFRFAVKLPRTITHAKRLVACEALVGGFAHEIAPLGAKRGPVLVQLPPSLAFDAEIASAFFAMLRLGVGGDIVCEPRHRSWFAPAAEAALAGHHIARVGADPPPVAGAEIAGGWRGLVYVRLHGSPRKYWSPYRSGALAAIGEMGRRCGVAGQRCWVIFDNTASGAAVANALDLDAMMVLPERAADEPRGGDIGK